MTKPKLIKSYSRVIVSKFKKDEIYVYNQGVGYDPEFPEYTHIKPTVDDPGNITVVDCYIVNVRGEVCPGYEYPVPVLVENIGKRKVSSMRRRQRGTD